MDRLALVRTIGADEIESQFGSEKTPERLAYCQFESRNLWN
ncbi:MAG: hypothetical protein ACI97A_003829 [Planctomycetota bacterium]|jgi:hypothetical protein